MTAHSRTIWSIPTSKIYYLVSLVAVMGCASSPMRYSVDADVFRTAPIWDTSFVHLSAPETGLILELSMPTPHGLRDYRIPPESLRSFMTEFTVEIFRYPLDTTLRKMPPLEAGVFGPHSNFRYEIKSVPLRLHGVKMIYDSQAQVPTRVDTAEGRYYFNVPAGKYLVSVAEWYFMPQPEVVRDVEIRSGDLSVVKIRLMPQRIF